MNSNREYKYSVLKLIEAVRVRPELWDSTRPEYRSYKNKDKVWQDVFEELDDNYRLLNKKEQAEIAVKITTKWRNIRDVFIRSVKKRATGRKMKKYMYHDRLSFMLKLYSTYVRPDSPGLVQQSENPYNTYMKAFHEHRAQRSISFDNVPENSQDEKPKPADSNLEEEDDDSFSIKTEPESQYEDDEELINNCDPEVSLNPKNISADDEFEFDGISSSENHQAELKRHNMKPSPRRLEQELNHSFCGRIVENVAILQADEDEAFLTSILPSLRDMSLDEKLEFRIAVLQNISNIRSKRKN